MPLVDSPRLTAQDRDAWQRLERYDHAYPAGRVDELADQAEQVIAHFTTSGGRAHVSTSWGKDSTVIVDLVGNCGVDVPVVWVRVDGYDLPECETVRDDMLRRHPHLRYDELTFPPQAHRWWSDGERTQTKAAETARWGLIDDRYGTRHITGIRGEESRIRSIVQARWGTATAQTCRPIGDWTAVDVFAYLHHRGLPVHPAYAMSHGGHLDRRWLRVHSLGGVTGADRGRADWESHYYGDVITASRHRDAVMSSLPRSRRDAVTVSDITTRTGIPGHVVGAALATAGRRVLSVNRCGQVRYWSAVDWPPAMYWLVQPPAADVRTEVTLL